LTDCDEEIIFEHACGFVTEESPEGCLFF
jgi:hypothetical protein